MILKLNYLSIISLFFFTATSAQVPNGYYDSAKNLSDENLKYALNQIIDNHTEYTYTSASIDVWDILKETDRDPNNAENVILIYSGISVNAAQEYNSANGWTREHIWAKSRGDFGISTGVGTDVHALRPLDNTTNSIRNNRSFNNCNTCLDVTDKWGNITGSKKDAIDWSFEPRDAVKGDVARMMFYMVVRYEGLDSYPDLELTEAMLPQSNKGNRNPFLDFPELAEHLWGTEMGLNWTAEPLGIENFNEVSFSIYPNPASNSIHFKGVVLDTKVEIYDAIGRKVLASQINVNKNTIDVSGLKGIYVVTIFSQEKNTTKILVIK
jgi:endonuclease I